MCRRMRGMPSDSTFSASSSGSCARSFFFLPISQCGSGPARRLYSPAMCPRPRLAFVLAAAALAAVFARPCAAQDRVRFGVVFGGLGFIGAVAEGIWEDRAAELVVSTYSFHDLSLSAAGKQFFGDSWMKPAVGAGLTWMLARSDEGAGNALIARFPLGGDWKMASGHFLTWEVNVTRALFVSRPDPNETTPPT